MSNPLLVVDDLHVDIHTSRGLLKAIRGVSFEVTAGEALGIVGESGSGKSITLKAILDLLPNNATITRGEIIVDGVNVLSLPASKRRTVLAKKFGIVFQDAISALNPVLSVGDQIMEVPRYRLGYSKDKAKAKALELMNLVGIPEAEKRLKSYPHQLSGGLRQRVAIALALAGEPKMLFCDEPTTALDVTIQAQVLRLLIDLRRREQMGLIFVTHDLAVINEVCESLQVMYGGRIVEKGSVQETYADPQHPYTFSLLKSVPDPDIPVERLFSIAGEAPDLTKPVAGCPFAPRCFAATSECQTTEPNLSRAGNGEAACLRIGSFKAGLTGIKGAGT